MVDVTKWTTEQGAFADIAKWFGIIILAVLFILAVVKLVKNAIVFIVAGFIAVALLAYSGIVTVNISKEEVLAKAEELMDSAENYTIYLDGIKEIVPDISFEDLKELYDIKSVDMESGSIFIEFK